MNYTYANILMISAVISFTLAILAWRRQISPGANSLAAVLISVGLWSGIYAMRWTTSQTTEIYFWLNLTYSGTVIAPAAMLIFALQFTDHSWKVNWRKIALFTIEPAITLIVIWTDPLHHLFFGENRSLYSILTGGFWFWLNSFYAFALMILALFTLHRHIRQASAITRHQLKIIILGYLIPIVICSVEILGFSPIKNLDITPFTFIISGFLIIYGFFFYKLLDITPAAYSKLALTTTDALVFLDSQCRIAEVNPAARKLFPSSAGLIGEEADKLFSDWPEIITHLNDPDESTLILPKTASCQKTLEVSILPLEEHKNSPSGWFLVFHDITRYKETEEALQISENKIRSLFNSLTDIVLVLDKDGKYLDIAPTIPAIPERDPLNLLGNTIFSLFPTEEAERILNLIRQALQTRQLVQIDYPLHYQGKEFWYAGNISALDENTVIWVARDITERKHMEQTLRESEARLAMAQKISQIGSWEFNLQTGKFWASDEYLRIMGVPLASSLESLEDLSSYIRYKDNSDLIGQMKSWMQNLTPFDQNIEIIRKGEGEPRILHCISSVFQITEGKPYKATGVVQDITEQKMVERALENRVLALTRPLDSSEGIDIEDLFNLEDLQRLQDDFAFATGVASIITRRDGHAITRNSNFCRLCGDLIRKHEIGGVECEQNDAEVCQLLSDHSIILPCKSIGLMHAGAPITVGGQYLASWIIGQVRTEDSSEETLLEYCKKLNLNADEALTAYREVPFMTRDKFAAVTQALFTLSNQISNTAYQNVQQARFISERKQAEEALRISENKLRSLLSAMTDVIIILDADGYQREIPMTAAKGYYLPPEEMLDKSVHELFPPEIAILVMNTIQQTLKSQEANRVEYSLNIGGEDFWFLANVSPISTDRVIWVARDITERKQMEQSLRENRARLEMAQRIAKLGNWEYDINSDKFWASEEYYRILGIDPEKGIHTLDGLISEFTRLGYTHFAKNVRPWMKTMRTQEGDLEITREGDPQPLIIHSISSAIFDADGKTHKASGVIQDITAQKRVERALEKRMVALTRPLDNPGKILIEDLFNLDDLQKLQDDFANATGVASLITEVDGTPITRPSNFGRLCLNMIRKTEQGRQDCFKVDSKLSKFNGNYPIHTPCTNIGSLHAGAPIMVGGEHIASWVIGQARTEASSEDTALAYFRKLGLNEVEALEAFRELPFMTEERFKNVTQALFTLTTQLSSIAYQNVQQARFITDRKKAEEALKQSENKLRSLFTAMTDVIMIFDAEGIFREVPPTGGQIFNEQPESFIGKSIKDVFNTEIASLFYKTIQQTLESKEIIRVDYCLQISGFEYWFSANVSPLNNNSVIWVARDITERKRAENSLKFQSMHDTLTGLYNRQYYETEIERLQRSRLFPISMLVMDVDGLKWINDNRGHSAGDELLKRVAAVLKSTFRPEDMVARMGGDEFVVVLPETGEAASHEAVQRLEAILEKHNALYPAGENLSLSIGVATGGQGILLTEVFKLADQAMYIKKKLKKEQTGNSAIKI
ncbi:MAG: PAS domain S-box protein [Leptolinea sp.]|jgi:diguanylate cyclase (GGDEF)-like protein/PAS domain S-box-containing protein|nr:PAS domain S-box protein [Leptolinea sp.]